MTTKARRTLNFITRLSTFVKIKKAPWLGALVRYVCRALCASPTTYTSSMTRTKMLRRKRLR